MVEVTPEQLELLVEALDSHTYWQLSDEQYRNNGYVSEKGSDDPEKRAQIEQTRKLAYQLEQLKPDVPDAAQPKIERKEWGNG